GLDAAPPRAALAHMDLGAPLRESNGTTGWWTSELLRRAGLRTRPDFSRTFIATASRDKWDVDGLKVSDAYRLFHEVVPATDLGRRGMELTAPQRAFVEKSLPQLLQVSRAAGDLDAGAEVLVSAALLGHRELPMYRDGIAWVLAWHRGDGTFRDPNDRSRPFDNPEAHRHRILVSSWALLTSLARPSAAAARETAPGAKR
ncbi:MAG TPA: hypothetical protein VJ829_11635, partial [Candidatus Binatia bacterium]|nr:hypothetical protein [Candidatus Binatia bacterium]